MILRVVSFASRMGTLEERERRIRERIKAISQRPRAVLFSEIDWVMTRLSDDLGHRVIKLGQNKHFVYTVDDLDPFSVVDHHKGQKEVKVCYVRGFLARMMELGLL